MAGTYTITVLPAHVFVLGFEPRISRVLGERHNQARPYEQASNEDRTRDLALTKRMLCQLSYRGETQPASHNFCGDAAIKNQNQKESTQAEIRTRDFLRVKQAS